MVVVGWIFYLVQMENSTSPCEFGMSDCSSEALLPSRMALVYSLPLPCPMPHVLLPRDYSPPCVNFKSPGLVGACSG